MKERLEIKIRRQKLPLKKPFKLAHGTYNYRENIFFLVVFESFYGIGEAPVVPYYGHTPGLIEDDLKKITPSILLPMIKDGMDGNLNWDIPVETMPARCAVESALVDILSQIAGKGFGSFLEIHEGNIEPTSYTVTGSNPKEIIDDASESPSSVLKVKAGVGDDYNIISSLRHKFPEYTIRIDVNQGWAIGDALKNISALEELNIDLIEEPIKGSFRDLENLARESTIPLFIDESFQSMDELYLLRDIAPSVKGIVVKIAKSGGPVRALSLIRKARKNGLYVMISSMVESSVGVSVAASIAPLCTHVDLDSPFLFRNEPFNLVSYNGNRIELPDDSFRRKKVKQILAEFTVDE